MKNRGVSKPSDTNGVVKQGYPWQGNKEENFMQKLLFNKKSLNFPSSLEKLFYKERAIKMLKSFRYIIGASVIFLILFGVLDVLFGLESSTELWRIRISLMMVLVAVMLLAYSVMIANCFDFVVATTVVAVTIGYSGMALLSPESIKWVYYIVGIVSLCWIPMVTRISFYWGVGLMVFVGLMNEMVWVKLDALEISTIAYLNMMQLLVLAAVLPVLHKSEKEDRKAFIMHHKQNLMQFKQDDLEESESRLRFLVVLDSLTGLANKRSFERATNMEWNRSGRSRRPVGVLRLEIDQYKELEENGGVEAIESVTRSLSDIIRNFTRRSGDLPAYFLDGQFALLLPDTDLNSCYQVASKINKNIAKSGLTFSANQEDRLTVSIGVTAMVPRPQFMYEEILNTSEEALRRAQALGAEQIICL